MPQAIGGLVVSAVGLAAHHGGRLLAQATTTPADDIAAWISGGGAAAAVGGLVYIARLMAAGKHRPGHDMTRLSTSVR